MRLQNLTLVRYGKFTDTEIALPKAAHDFHLIIGPNEAGKSTLRGAIADLLFGFPTRAGAMAFVHPQPDLCLAAQVTDGGDLLDFVRVKATRNTLRSPADAVLADDALDAYLGAADRKFFEHMFGLGHAQLVEGGQSVLDASKDVSQVLFQSAAGIAGLGKVKDALRAEADTLWATRHSGSRAYYAASDRCDAAAKDLKAATVRTKAWTEASSALAEIEGRIEAARLRKAQLQASRVRLERVRRLASAVQVLRSKLSELGGLGEVLELPAHASEVLSAGPPELSLAETVLQQRRLAVDQLTDQRDGASYDAKVLAFKADIEALAAQGESVRNHYADLAERQAEVGQHLALAAAAAAELGWPVAEASLSAQLPASGAMRDVQSLLVAHGGLLETKSAATSAAEIKQAELEAAKVELEDTPGGEVSTLLRSAVSEAQGHKNTASSQARLSAAAQAAERALEAALAGLGAWRRDVPALQQMPVPSPERLSGLIAKRHALETEASVALDRIEEAQMELNDAQLAAQQYKEARHIVTGAEVREARGGRDSQWLAIKTGSIPVESGAAGLDAAIALADELVDAHLGSVTEAAQLQSLRQRVERAEAELVTRRQTGERKDAALSMFDGAWEALSTASQLPGLALADGPAWTAKRELALAAAAACQDRQADLQQERQSGQATTAALTAQLVKAGLPVPDDSPLSAVLVQAEAFIAEVDGANARRTHLRKQLDAAQTSLAKLRAASESASAAYVAWETRWAAAVASAGLEGVVKAVTDAEHALLRVEAVRQNLEKAAAIRRDRIDTMNRDLATFAAMATEMVNALGIEELEGEEPRQVVRALTPRLRDAETGHARRATAEDALQVAERQRDEAQRGVERVRAKLAPLLAAAGVASLLEAAHLAERSDQKRKLTLEIEQARAAIVRGSDGLGLDELVVEVESCDLVQVAAELSTADDKLDQVQSDLTRLAEERLRAEQAVQAIGGGNDAATAEARRQEALAAMADASDRYIKVTAAARLLSWAIDRYRQQNQGPLLSRAGAIFAKLTLGRFTKLFVDYEKAPPSLSALRANGQVVEVPGLSEGTRDQLYLALRLAALEIHLDKAKALPFVADDLYINFDDDRSTAGLEALKELSTQTQVLFLSHHEHLLPRVQTVFGAGVNVVRLPR